MPDFDLGHLCVKFELHSLIVNRLGETKLESIFNSVSVLSGPLLACTCASFLCLIPFRNVLKYPGYWYEEQFARFLAAYPIIMSQPVAMAFFWCRLPFEKPLVKSFMSLVGVGCLIYIIVQASYYAYWTYNLGLYQPMPFNGYLGGTLGTIVIMVAIWFRYF